MNPRFPAVLLCILLVASVPGPLAGCTGIVVGREASDDGSVLNSKQQTDGMIQT